MLSKEIIAVYSENRTEPMDTKYWDTVKIAGTYNYHQDLKG
jgi:hypothetical protein